MSKNEVKLHALLAAEKTVSNQTEKLITETIAKLGKEQFFSGYDKTLTLTVENSQKDALEKAARDTKELQTTVPATLEYTLGYWAKREDLLSSKNNSNRFAVANIEVDGKVLASDVPVDELMGLESRLTALRGVFAAVPTLDASKKWSKDENAGAHIWKLDQPEVTVKTEKTISSVILAPATDKFPAQIEKISKDETVGYFTLNKSSGAVTAAVKAEMLSNLDTLIAAVKQARVNANDVQVASLNLGKALIDFITAPLASA